MAQWTLPDASPDIFQTMKAIGYEGIQMDMGLNDCSRDLRNKEMLNRYLKAKKQTHVIVPSLALNFFDFQMKELEIQKIVDQALSIAHPFDAQGHSTLSDR